MASPEALGFGGLLTNRGERATELRGKRDLLVVDVGSEAIEIAHLRPRARMIRVVDTPHGIAHGLQSLRMGLQEQTGPLPLCALVATLSDDATVNEGAPDTLRMLRERVPMVHGWETVELGRRADREHLRAV